MIYVGIDDTDTLDSRGTNQLAKAMARAVADEYVCHRIVRHQLLEDPRVPFTSKNGSASLVFEYRGSCAATCVDSLACTLRQIVRDDFIPGSDPGLCVATEVDAEVIAFAAQCEREFVTQEQARDTAARSGVFLEGLGGTNDGVIGALAAVGLAAANDGGRVVQWGNWPDDLTGTHPVDAVRERAIEIQQMNSSETVHVGCVDVGKHLRPNWRDGRCVLFVTSDHAQSDNTPNWKAVKIP
ncbi:MAG: hypothetical protein QGG71_16820 [Pirellulaceae bacterium]|nr:hypothetical protein [Pirellulaceae bacterium]